VVAPEGQASGTIPLALNDPPGKWTVQARDVASGVKAATDFVVAQP